MPYGTGTKTSNGSDWAAPLQVKSLRPSCVPLYWTILASAWDNCLVCIGQLSRLHGTIVPFPIVTMWIEKSIYCKRIEMEGPCFSRYGNTLTIVKWFQLYIFICTWKRLSKYCNSFNRLKSAWTSASVSPIFLSLRALVFAAPPINVTYHSTASLIIHWSCHWLIFLTFPSH